MNSIEGGRVGVSAGPAVGIPGGEFGSSIDIGSTIINEGPMAPKFLENTMPLTLNSFKPLGEIIFNPFRGKEAAAEPLVIQQAEEVAATAWKASEPASVIEQAEAIAAKAWKRTEPIETGVLTRPVDPEPLSEATAVREAEYWLNLHKADRTQVVRVLETAAQAGIKPEVSRRWVTNALLVTQAQVRPESQAQTWIETKQQVMEQQEVIEEEKDDEQLETREKEESREMRRRYVVDERALSQIMVEIKAAVVKAKEEAGKLGIRLTGWLVDKFLPGQHSGNESEVVKGKGPDGSIPERKEAIYAHGEFTSEIEAENTSVRIAYEKPPVAIRQDGQPVTKEDVYRVYKEHRIKPKPVTEVRMRVIKKETVQKTTITKAGSVLPVYEEVAAHQQESKIEDNPELAEVFAPLTS